VKSFLAPSAASKFGKKSQLHNAARSATASGSSSTAGVNGFGADVAKDAAAPPAAAEVKVPEVNWYLCSAVHTVAVFDANLMQPRCSSACVAMTDNHDRPQITLRTNHVQSKQE
jgi:hypothetical protein